MLVPCHQSKCSEEFGRLHQSLAEWLFSLKHVCMSKILSISVVALLECVHGKLEILGSHKLSISQSNIFSAPVPV